MTRQGALLWILCLSVGCDGGPPAAPKVAAPVSIGSVAATPAPSSPAPAEPRFEDFPVEAHERVRGEPAAVDFSANPASYRFRTRLRNGAAAGPNFAGSIAAVQWGCGTNCRVIAFVEVSTGRVLRQTMLTSAGVDFRRDSRLLIADPPHGEHGGGRCDHPTCGFTRYYEWRGDRLFALGDRQDTHLHNW
jgi:hypothetical protein